jgi:hypothetical protein
MGNFDTIGFGSSLENFHQIKLKIVRTQNFVKGTSKNFSF